VRSFISEKKVPHPTLTDEGIDLNRAVEDFESSLIDEALRRTNGNKSAAARLLGVKRPTLVAKLLRRNSDPLTKRPDGSTESDIFAA
jgi:DNA-binding NtrC family response regulator